MITSLCVGTSLRVAFDVNYRSGDYTRWVSLCIAVDQKIKSKYTKGENLIPAEKNMSRILSSLPCLAGDQTNLDHLQLIFFFFLFFFLGEVISLKKTVN